MRTTEPARSSWPARLRVGCLLAALLAPSCADERAPGRLLGTVERDRVELIAEAQEPLVEIAVREGDRVAAGGLVVRLSDERASLELRRLESLLAGRAAVVAEAVTGPRAERLAEARARVEGARSDLDTARADLDRQRALLASGVVAEQAVDHAENVFDSSRARLEQVQAELDELVAGTRSEELEAAIQAEAAARAELASAQLSARRLEVRAPVESVVDALPYELGERPPPGAVLAVLLRDGSPWVRVFVPEPRRASVAVGDAVTVRLEGDGRVFRGRVRRVRSEAAFSPYYALTEHDRGRLAYETEIELTEEAARGLPTGIPVEVELGVEPTGADAIGDG